MIEYLDEIRDHLEEAYPAEGCGILAVVKGKLKWFPCSNMATDINEHFIIDSKRYLQISRSSDIVGIVHSHPDESCAPSDADIKHCNVMGVPYYIFSYPSMDLHIQKPVVQNVPLMGREYEFGYLDCFEAVRDWYKQELKLDVPKRDAYEDDWWLKGLDYFNVPYIISWGFTPVEKKDIQKGDLLVFAVGSIVGNHCGVYLGHEIFYHHAHQRLSCRENIQPFWQKYLIGVFRYET
jgi:proteasome lid subunit RPN8/RPN11